MVGTYSPGNEFVVYEMSIQVFPTEPSPTTTHFISLSAFAISERGKEKSFTVSVDLIYYDNKKGNHSTRNDNVHVVF